MSGVRLGSMFSGVGGLDLAMGEALGAQTVFVADVCKFDKDGNPGHYEPHRSPCTVLAHRFPGVPCPVCLGDGSGEHLRALDAVLADLAAIGFDADWTVVPASGVGAAHRRERWFCAACPRRGTSGPPR